MIASTLLAIAGAGLGGYSGILTNEERLRRARTQVDELNAAGRTNLKSEMSFAKILKGDISLAALDMTNQSESDAEAVGKLRGTLEQQAGVSGLKGGSPFFMLSSQVAKASRTLAMAETARAMQLKGRELQGAAQIDQYRLKSQEIALEAVDVSHSANYYNSVGAQALAFGTGVMSGIATANQISTVLEAIGVDMSADPLESLFSGINTKKSMTGQASGAGGDAADVTVSAGGDIAPETMGTLAVREDTVAPHEMTRFDIGVINSVAMMRTMGDVPDLYGSVYGTQAQGGGSGIVDLFADKVESDRGLMLASPDLAAFEGVKYPKPSGVSLFGNNNLFEIQ